MPGCPVSLAPPPGPFFFKKYLRRRHTVVGLGVLSVKISIILVTFFLESLLTFSMTSTKPRRGRGRPSSIPQLRKEAIIALRSLRKVGLRQRGRGSRGTSRYEISIRMVRGALPPHLQKVGYDTLDKACKGLKRFWKHPLRAKASVSMSDEAWSSLCWSSRRQGWG